MDINANSATSSSDRARELDERAALERSADLRRRRDAVAAAGAAADAAFLSVLRARDASTKPGSKPAEPRRPREGRDPRPAAPNTPQPQAQPAHPPRPAIARPAQPPIARPQGALAGQAGPMPASPGEPQAAPPSQQIFTAASVIVPQHEPVDRLSLMLAIESERASVAPSGAARPKAEPADALEEESRWSGPPALGVGSSPVVRGEPPEPAARPAPPAPPPALVHEIVQYAAVERDRDGYMQFVLGAAPGVLGGLQVRLTAFGQRRIGICATGADNARAAEHLEGLVQALRRRGLDVVDTSER